MKFRLSQKGLLIAAVPLMFEIAIISFLFHQVNEAEALAQAAIRARQISVGFHDLTADTLHLALTVGQYKVTDPGLSKIFREELQRVRHDMEHIRALVKDDPRYQPMIRRASSLVQDLDTVTTNLLDRYDKNDLNGLADLAADYKHKYYSLMKNPEVLLPFKEFARAEAEIYKTEPERQTLLRRRTRLLLCTALLVSTMISVFTTAFFAYQITRRLKTMTQNTQKLKGGKPLNALIGGADEIADLDRTFHAMAGALQAAREKELANQQLRDQVVRMVSHDLRTPLQTVTTFLEFMEVGDIQADMREPLKKTIADAERMGKLINDLLNAERAQETEKLASAGLASPMPSE